MPKKKAISGPAHLPCPLDSDSDDDFYSNILDRKRKEVTKKRSPKKSQIVLPDDSLLKDDSLLDESCEEEMSLAERLRLHCEERNKMEKDEAEKELEAVRMKALLQYNTPCTSDIYVNPNVADIKKKLRYIHEIESKLEQSPSERLNMHRSFFAKANVQITEKVHVTVEDLEFPANPPQTFDWPMDEPFERMIDTIGQLWEVESSCVRLEEAVEAKRVCSGHTPKNFGLQPHEYIRFTAMIIGRVIPRSLHSVKGDLSKVELKCQMEDGRRSKKISVKTNATFAEIKEAIKDVLQILSISKLVFDAEQVRDTDSPESLDMEDGSMVDVYQ